MCDDDPDEHVCKYRTALEKISQIDQDDYTIHWTGTSAGKTDGNRLYSEVSSIVSQALCLREPDKE